MATPQNPVTTLTRPVRGVTTVAMVLAALASLCGIVPFIAVAELTRLLLAGDGPGAGAAGVWTTVWLVIGGLLGRTMLMGAALAMTHQADATLQATLARRMAAHLSTLPLGWFAGRTSGHLRKTVQNDVHDLHYLVAHARVETVAAVVLPLGALAYLVAVDWRLAILAVVTIPVYVVAYAVMTRGMGEQMLKMNAALGAVSSSLVEFVSGIAVVKTYGGGRRAHRAYREAAETFGQTYAAWVGPMLRTDALGSLAVTPPVVLLVSLAGCLWLVSGEVVEPVAAVTELMIAVMIPGVLVTLGFGASAKREATAAAGRIQALLDTPSLVEPVSPRVPADNTVVFAGVSFSYDGERDVLQGIDLECSPGTVTAVVGPSGAGKSTLVELLPRFWDASAGAVTIGGVDVRDIAGDELYRHVSFVLQDVALLTGSVADNIRLGRRDASDAEVRAAAEAAQIHTRVESLPRGYDSVVGEDARFSGGELQRISIARAILHNAPILVLDEATAFADPQSEAAIQSALSRLIVGRTVLVVAHRLHTITAADRIVVLRDGRIVEQGRHEALLVADGEYARLWAAQTGPDPALVGAAPASASSASASSVTTTVSATTPAHDGNPA